MRRTATLVVLAGLLTACGGTDDTATSPPSSPPATTPAAAGTAPAAPAAPASTAPSVPSAGASAPSLSPAKQAEALDKIYARLDAKAQKQFCAQSDSVGPEALAEQVSQQGGSAVDEKVVKDFLIDKCGKS